MTRPAPLDALQSDVDYRIASLQHIRLSRLNASAWRQADAHWFRSLHRAGVLAAPEASVLLDSYIEARDQLLGPGGHTGARATWSRNRLPLSDHKLAATETFWQVAGFALWRRFQVRSTAHRPGR